MELNVSQIDEYDGLTLEESYPNGEPHLEDEEAKLLGQTRLHVHATRDGDEVLLRGNIQAEVQFACDRCLTSFVIPVAQSFDLLYIAASKRRTSPEEHELKADDLSIAYFDGHLINLDDLVREQIELTLPMTRICVAGCRGLCPQCGVNLNEGECTCATEQTDPRWDALKGLKVNK